MERRFARLNFSACYRALCREYLASAAALHDGRHRLAHPVDVFAVDVSPGAAHPA